MRTWHRAHIHYEGSWPLIPGAQSLMDDVPSIRLRTHDLAWCRASCPLGSRYIRDIRGCGLHLYSGRRFGLVDPTWAQVIALGPVLDPMGLAIPRRPLFSPTILFFLSLFYFLSFYFFHFLYVENNKNNG